MSKLDDFIALLETEARNHSIYVWGAQGQTKPTITEAWIRSRENSTTNANRAIAYWKKQVAAGYGDVLKAFDCSGLGVWAMQQLGIITNKDDMTAAGMYSECAKLDEGDLKRGDRVFCHNGTKIVHVGYVVNDNLDTIEAYGRDLGVVKRKLSQGEWNRYGRPPCFKADIEGGASAPTAAVSKPYIEALGSVNVRDKPNATGKVLGVARKGDRLPLADSGWHHVILNGKEGYISGKTNLTKRVD